MSASFVDVTVLRQAICPTCGPLGPLAPISDGEATGTAVKHDAIEHGGYTPEGEDG